MMSNLCTYVSAINSELPNELIVEKALSEESFEENGILTENSELVVIFSNGVTIKQSVELDSNIIVPGMACAECWISYEVISEPKEIDISPKQKSFTNKCQESFWLKISAAQASFTS
jgi:hypothetical protein